MESRELAGLPAISADEGARIGTVERAFLDPARQQIIGFAIDRGAGPFEPESSLLADVIEVRSLGPGALVLVTPRPTGLATVAGYDNWVDLDGLRGREVLGESGDRIGHVDSVDFDERAFTLTGLRITAQPGPGYQTIAPNRLLSIGPDVIIVTRSVVTPVAETASAKPGAATPG